MTKKVILPARTYVPPSTTSSSYSLDRYAREATTPWTAHGPSRSGRPSTAQNDPLQAELDALLRQGTRR